MSYNHSGQAAGDPYNGNIEGKNEIRWKESTCLEEEQREIELAIAASLENMRLDRPPALRKPIDKYMCDKCDLKFSSQEELADHMDMYQQAFEVGRGERTDKKDRQMTYPCAKCHQLFHSDYDASEHRAMHERSWDDGWAAHRAKRDTRIFGCPKFKCYAAFTNQDALDGHRLREHAKFRCSRIKCGKGFDTEDDLAYHVWETHGLF